jgi:septation ring formation regulator EzrA
MSEKKMTKQEYLQIKSKLEARKAELLEIKKAGGKSWTESLQEELDNIAMSIADVEDKIDAIPATTKDESSAYKPAEGTEKMVHLSIVHGRRFNSMTGKEISKPYTQLFTYSEWQLFKNNFASLGYTIMKVLHDPYGEAAKFVTK